MQQSISRQIPLGTVRFIEPKRVLKGHDVVHL
jgi:hypothetical protein